MLYVQQFIQSTMNDAREHNNIVILFNLNTPGSTCAHVDLDDGDDGIV